MGLLEKEPERLVKELSLYSEVPIVPDRTLIILDEIQECEEALNSLKYFCEDAPQYHIIAAGSLLGVAVKRKNMSVPVGKVRTMKIHPLSFKEFLAKSDPDTYDFIENISAIGHLPEIILNKAILEYAIQAIPNSREHWPKTLSFNPLQPFQAMIYHITGAPAILLKWNS